MLIQQFIEKCSDIMNFIGDMHTTKILCFDAWFSGTNLQVNENIRIIYENNVIAITFNSECFEIALKLFLNMLYTIPDTIDNISLELNNAEIELNKDIIDNSRKIFNNQKLQQDSSTFKITFRNEDAFIKTKMFIWEVDDNVGRIENA